MFCSDEENTTIFRVIIFEADVIAGTTHSCFCHWTKHICFNLFNYTCSRCPSSETLCAFPKAQPSQYFCFHTNAMLLEHLPYMVLILLKTLMPYLQCFLLRCQVDLLNVWTTYPNRQLMEVINERNQCCNSSVTSVNNDFLFLQSCAVAVLGSCLDGE
jgi:hypothetical protein